MHLPIDADEEADREGEEGDDMRVVVGDEDEESEDDEQAVEGEVHNFLRDSVVFW